MNHNQETDLSIWNKMVEGDPSAFKHIYLKYAPELFTYGCHFTSDEDLVKDCIQELFANIYQKKGTISQPKNVKFYLLLAMKNQLYMEFRKNKFTSHLEIESLVFTGTDYADANLSDKEEQDERKKKNKAIQELLNKLPSRQKEIIYYRYIQGLSLDEICKIMDLQYQSANNLIYRALSKVKSYVGILLFLFFLFFLKKLS